MTQKTQLPNIYQNFKGGILHPFSPGIGKMTLSPELIAYLLKGMEASTEDFGQNLAGVIKSQPAFLENTGQRVMKEVGKFVLGFAGAGVTAASAGIYAMDLKTMESVCVDGWFVDQKEKEFNPMHSHINCQMSSVGYLEVPKQIAEPEDKWDSHGCIEFSYGTPTTMVCTGVMFRPKVGDFYVFPSWLNHTVYPFKGEGHRKAFSMNFSIREKNDQS